MFLIDQDQIYVSNYDALRTRSEGPDTHVRIENVIIDDEISEANNPKIFVLHSRQHLETP
jgi:hypothetical protein